MSILHTSDPLVSIVVPCYNAERTIESCLDSLLGQEFQRLEIICVNDGSTDKTAEMLDLYRSRYPEVVVASQENSGAWAARLSGIQKAEGDYIMFLDSDDVAVPGFITKMYEFASSINCDLAVCGFNRIDAATGKLMSAEFCKPLDSFSLCNNPSRLLQINPAPWNKIYKASLLKGVHRLSVAPVMLDDLSLLLLALLRSDGLISYLPEALVEYRVHSDSTINSINTGQLKEAIMAMAEIRSYYKDCRSAEMLEAFDAVAFAHIVVSMSFRLLGSGISNATNVIDALIAAVDCDFPLWRTSRYLSLGYGCKKGGIFLKAALASSLVKIGLFKFVLFTYRFVKKTIGKDISW
ncbi:glycosyltransferase family 2 protein [Collinsella sp. HCP28S3_E5]|uniref:glycosyltransferase family 2 protein n=1 Tax=Collinsella sp. HCP28S3_E5 TaxID=3438922 RepID=UPI003F89D23D